MNTILTWFLSLSFLFYGISYFFSPFLKAEFKRFGLEKYGLLTGILEILGAIGMLAGLSIPVLLTVSSFGLGILMMLGFGVRIKIKDSLWQSAPAFFFMLLNFYIFYSSLKPH